jgi:GNAT superfamily N-acetyltransferase
MITIEQVDLKNRKAVNEFVQFQYDLYKGVPQFCPPFYADIKLMMNKQKHPFFEHSDGDFFVARQDGKVAGRIAVMETRPFNKYHQTQKAQFYLFDSINDQEVANKLFDAAFDWARARGLNQIVGPKGFNAFDGYGIQTEGYEHHQMMIMMNYNFPYYVDLVTNLGFETEVDFMSCYLPVETFQIPEHINAIAEKVIQRGTLKVVNFKSKADVKKFAPKIGEAYNDTFINNWEYYPLSKREVKKLLDDLLTLVVPGLIKIIMHEDKIVGFLLGFPDITEALQRGKGHITPWAIIDIMRSVKTTKWISLNGAGVLPEYYGRGANALLYYEMGKTLRDSHQFVHGELTQVANTAEQMRKDMIRSGGIPYKNHRVYHRDI